MEEWEKMETARRLAEKLAQSGARGGSRTLLELEIVDGSGFECEEKSRRVVRSRSHAWLPELEEEVRIGDEWGDVNSSEADKFLDLISEGPTLTLSPYPAQEWADVNFVATHGYFMRCVMTACGMDSRPAHVQNLMMLKVSVGDRCFVLVRHCTRQYQGNFLMERVTPDPGCARYGEEGEEGQEGVSKICNEDAFRKSVRSCVRDIASGRGGGRSTTVRVFSSCARRAVETAEVILASLKETEKGGVALFASGPEVVLENDFIQVLPFCREATNHLGHLDFMNPCSKKAWQHRLPPRAP